MLIAESFITDAFSTDTMTDHKSTKWTKVVESVSDATVNFVVAMNPKKESSKDLQRFLDESSDPSSDMYGKILSKEEFESMRVDVDAYEKVRSYLKNEIPSARFDRVGRHLIVSGVSVKEIDRLFDTKMEMFRHKVTKHIVHNSLKRYTIPSEISEYVRHVFGLSSTLVDALDVVQQQQHKTRSTFDVPPLLADPNYLRNRYDIDSECTGENVALLTVLKLLPSNFFSPSDLNSFNIMYDLPTVKVDLETASSDSACWSDPDNCVENNLDVQYASSTARYCSVHYAQLEEDRLNLATASRLESFVGSVLNILDSTSTNRKRILSASYTIAARAIPPSARQELADMIQESTAQGTTFVVASGDDGAKSASGTCSYFDDTSLASPYAVVVGGTSWKNSEYPSADATEVAAMCGNLPDYSTITSGGSFAWHYDKPNFQGNRTSEYLARVQMLPSSSAYNPNGRGYPDVSALGDLYPIVINAKVIPVDGTSASTPYFAGVLSLLHDVAHANGDVLPSHINPVLYESVSSFHDITEGNNQCGRISSLGTCDDCSCSDGNAGGWYALEGWDPVTGLGTLNFTAFRVSKGWNATEYSYKKTSFDYGTLVIGLIAACVGIVVCLSVVRFWNKRSSSSSGDVAVDHDNNAGYVPMDDDEAVVIE